MDIWTLIILTAAAPVSLAWVLAIEYGRDLREAWRKS
jgi:hypothetical protein